jgi:enolase
MKITQINLKIIQDSRKEDTLEAVMSCGDLNVTSSVPAGKSKGKFETTSVTPVACLQKLEEIKDEIRSVDFSGVLEFDNFLKKLDGTPTKSNLGGNLILVLSICFTKLFAKINGLQTYQLIGQMLGITPNKFPYFFINLIGGGLHAKDSVPFQEQILVPKFASPSKSLEYVKLVIERLKKDVSQNFGEIRMGDEGTFSIKSDDPELGLKVLARNVDDPNVSLALDVAASSFYTGDGYKIGEKVLNIDELILVYQDLSSKFPLISIEDPFAEDDKAGFTKICEVMKDKIEIIGDDLTVTNVSFIQKAIDNKEITGVIIKPNQIGSVSETLNAIKLAHDNNIKTIVSHRSGETIDDFIADLAFGSQAFGLKSGNPLQPERLVKSNRLIEIEKGLNF